MTGRLPFAFLYAFTSLRQAATDISTLHVSIPQILRKQEFEITKMGIQTATLCTTAGYVNAQSRDQIFIYFSCIVGLSVDIPLVW